MPTTSICKGTATLWSTHPKFTGPTPHVFQFTATLPDPAGAWTVDNFTPIKVKDIPTGNDPTSPKVDLTVSLITPANGQRDAATGAMRVQARFKFKFSSFLVPSSTLDITLDTDTPAGPPPPERPKGERYAANSGAVTLAGTGILVDGTLNGVSVTVRLTGTFDPKL
jgi:hypothetical protein